MKYRYDTTYVATRPAQEFYDLDGTLESIDEEVFRFKVLPRPNTVIECSGHGPGRRVRLPPHLAGSSWLYVQRTDRDKPSWLFIDAVEIREFEE